MVCKCLIGLLLMSFGAVSSFSQDTIYIDRKLVHDKGVEIGKGAKRDGIKSLMRSKGGRDKLVNELPDDRKIEELKKLGYTLTKYDITDSDSLSAMLMEAWDDEYGVY